MGKLIVPTTQTSKDVVSVAPWFIYLYVCRFITNLISSLKIY